MKPKAAFLISLSVASYALLSTASSAKQLPATEDSTTPTVSLPQSVTIVPPADANSTLRTCDHESHASHESHSSHYSSSGAM